MGELLNKVKEEFTLERVLAMAMKTPGVRISRSSFLKRELQKYCSDDTISEAIKSNPAKAGISKEIINEISNKVINYESAKVTAISVAASLPSSAALPVAVASATADITSYFAFVLRIVQELAYLYGFEQFDFGEDNIDSETMSFVMVFVGVMFGVQGAASTLKKLAESLARHISNTLAKRALMKGAVYPFIKQIAKKVGIRMTKQIFADTVASAVPVAGSVLSGGLTYVMFRPCCMKLRKNLMSYDLCDPAFYDTIEADNVVIVDAVETDDIQ